ncbi:LuxR C-terminal-related transcriptional regulator [Kutzneria sp. NPDC051319]|uniref:LuxR C-terminal-related transcriptional regulator n=1 Tax=Kutzneria sp. NPDC051319 TaxID=3155047 RepID=UPI00341CE5D9
MLGGLAGGLRAEDIARELVIAKSTVNVHLHNAYRKLGVTSAVQAAAKAREMGLPERE